MTETPDFVLFLGRFHPLIVHLPIGFLVFAFLLELVGRKQKNTAIVEAIPLALMGSFLSAVVACILGYMLSLSGDYDEAMLDNHFWFGVITTILVGIAWLIRTGKVKLTKAKRLKANISALALTVILVSITGHYGGNLTHGSDYLTKYLPFNKKEKTELAKIERIEDAVVFDYLAKPILDNKCASCHNENKKKGGLSFQDSLAIFKGGKTGDVLVIGSAEDSEMIKRVLLEPHHDDFMPPEGKTPLTEEEIAILQYWINNAHANFNSTVGSVETPENILGIASNMLGFKSANKKGDIDLPAVSAVGESDLKTLMSEGFKLRELVFESNLYEVVLPTSEDGSNAENLSAKLEQLAKIKDNVVWLYIENNKLHDEDLGVISDFKNMQKLVINRNPITDSGVSKLKSNESLTSLNLYGTAITKASLETFLEMKNLEKVYAWETPIKEADLENFAAKENFPEVVLGP